MSRPPRVLHVLSQRPSHTGSGITLRALVHHASRAGWAQAVICGVPAEDAAPEIPPLDPNDVFPLVFDSESLPFPLPGMSDVMPYRSSRFSALTEVQVEAYRGAWRVHVSRVVEQFRPDVIHSHHLWLLSGLLKDVAPDVPVVTHSHATGLRQMTLAPKLGAIVRPGVRRNQRFLALHDGMVEPMQQALDGAAVDVIGAGFREDVFGSTEATLRRPSGVPSIVYAGKLSHAKALGELLDAFDAVRRRRPTAELHICGSGAGEEAQHLETVMAKRDGVVWHGMISQQRLAELFRSAWVFALPSLYEGLPLVLVEAAACGCRIVATALPGVTTVAGALGDRLTVIPMPELEGPDRLAGGARAGFVAGIEAALEAALAQGAAALPEPERLAPFTWRAVFARVEAIWNEVAEL